MNTIGGDTDSRVQVDALPLLASMTKSATLKYWRN